MASIKTRFLIISDTHGASLWNEGEGPTEHAFRKPLPSADVAIHCGDLTKGSSIPEYEATFNVMREIDAPLKLVIAGNHDMTLDRQFWANYCSWMNDADLLRKAQYPDQTYEVVERARQDGIYLLREGTYHFVLGNGARLIVYASPFTPVYGGWAFQYEDGHDFAIPEGADLAMTHGPPRDILDLAYSGSGTAAGCPHLLRSLARARPRMHCFGHIHEAWGAGIIRWNNSSVSDPTQVPAVNTQESLLIEDLKSLNGDSTDNPAVLEQKRTRATMMARDRCRLVSLCDGDARQLQYGKETLFVNAAIMNVRYAPSQLPWLVDLELPAPDAEHLQKARATTAALQTPYIAS